MNRGYIVTTVDKFHGPNAGHDFVELSDEAFDNEKSLAKALRTAKILSPGQRVRSFRGPNNWELGLVEGSPYRLSPKPADCVIVFPCNVPGLTTGLHSITLTPKP